MVTKQIKISVKNQITLPQIVLKKMGVGPGDAVQLSVEGKHAELLFTKKRKVSALNLGKMFKDFPKKHVSLAQMNKAIEEGYRDSAGSSL